MRGLKCLQPRGHGHCCSRGSGSWRGWASSFASPSSARASGSLSVAMARPALLHIAEMPLEPEVRKDFDAKFEHYYLWEQKDPDSFYKENGSLIKGVVTSTKGTVNEDLLNKLPNLEIVSSCSVGLDKVDLQLCKERGVVVTNTPEVLTDCTADTALALLLACMREIPGAERYVREGRWPIEGDYPVTTKVSGKRVGIVGLGRIGAAIARRCEGFGCPISYYARSKKSEFPNYTYYATVVDLARDSEILITACALTKETTKIINREVLDALGPNGFIVNIARGQVIDEGELVKALVEKRVAGAGLDVFENEPEVPKELFSMNNVVLQPHVGSATVETRNSMGNLVVANLLAHISGQPLLTPVDI